MKAPPVVLTAGLESGYVRLWRKILDSPVFQHPGLLKLWIWCLTRANWTPGTVSVKTGKGETLVKLEPGQFIFGRHAAAKALKCPPSTVQSRIAILEKLGNLVIKPVTHFSVVTVVNWALYQGDAVNLVTQVVTHSSPNRHREELKAFKKKSKPTSLPGADASGTGGGGNGQEPPRQRQKKKHPAYTMTPEEYAEYVRAGIGTILANQKKIDEWKGLYPAVDVADSIYNASGWLLDRTDTGEGDRRPHLVAFIGNWLRRANGEGDRHGR